MPRGGTCEYCDKPLLPIGDRRRNGDAEVVDWDTRCHHRKCYRQLRREEMEKQVAANPQCLAFVDPLEAPHEFVSFP
jgi:hypothetical protein